MDERPVVFLDSGIGSLPYGDFFHRRNPNEKLVCVADSANFPYGSKPKDHLVSILASLASSIIKSYNPKIIAIACNTASVSALDHLRDEFPSVPFVGTVPAIKPAVLSSKTKRIGVLGTERTIEDKYIRELAEQFGSGCQIIGEAAPDLVEFAERHYASASDDERLEQVKPWIEKFKVHGVDALVLGCTHFLLLAKEFHAAADGIMRVFDSLEGVCHRVEFILDRDEGKLRASSEGASGQALLAVTGEPSNKDSLTGMAARFGFTLTGFLCAQK